MYLKRDRARNVDEFCLKETKCYSEYPMIHVVFNHGKKMFEFSAPLLDVSTQSVYM